MTAYEMRISDWSSDVCSAYLYVQPHAETYMGLVEVGAGIIPAGGGSKEFAMRAAGEMTPGGIDELEVLKNRYMTIVMARVSTSAAEAFELGYLESSNASVSISRKWQLEQARRRVKSRRAPCRERGCQTV